MEMRSAFTKHNLLRAVLIGIGIVAAVWAGIMLPGNPILPISIGCGLVWAMLSLWEWPVALFVLGAAAVLLYLLDLRSDTFSLLLLAVFVLIAVFAMLRYQPYHSESPQTNLLIICVLAWGIYLWVAQSLGIIADRGWQFGYLISSSRTLMPLLWFALAQSGMRRGYGRRHLLAGIAAGALATAVVFLFNFRPWASDRSALDAWTDTYLIVGSLKNSLGLLWTIGVAILLGWRAGRWQSLKTVGLLILIVSIAYSFSRSSYLALLAVVLLSSRGRFWRKLLLLLLLGGVVSFLAPDVIWQRILLTWSADRGLDISSATRIELWWGAISAFLHYPFTGVGIRNFTEYLVRSGLMPTGADLSLVEFTYAHNYFLSLFALTGVVGGLLGIAVFWAAYQRSQALKARGDTVAVTVQACLAAFFVSSLYGEPLFDPVLLIVFIFIIGCLIPSESEQTDAASTSNSTRARQPLRGQLGVLPASEA